MVNQNEDQPVVVYLRDEGISRDEAVAYLQLLIEWVQVINREPAPTE
jgi:hypothetical protein